MTAPCLPAWQSLLRRLPWLFVCATLFAAASVRSQDDLVFEAAPEALDPTERVLLDITRSDGRLIAVGASGLVILSDDSGKSWRQASVPVSATLTAVDFPVPEHGWAVGHAGVILHSADGGETWQRQFDGRDANAALLDYARVQRERLEAELAALEASDEASADEIDDLVYRVEDAIFLEEDAQLAIDTGPADPLLDVAFFDGRRGFASGAYGMLLRTDDGGESWEIAIDGLDNPNRFHLYSILLTADEGIFIAGEAGLLFRSVDGGSRFERYYDVYDGSLFGVVQAGSEILTFGLRGNQFRYDAAADSWQALDSAFDSSLYGAAVLDDGTLLLLGAGGNMLRREPGGAERPRLHPSRGTLAGAAEAPDGSLWLVGMEGLVNYARARDQ